jgi:hypothetical protein
MQAQAPASNAPLPDRAVEVIESRCYPCHTTATKMGNIQLASAKDVQDASSKLLAAIRYDGKIKMPPAGRLAETEATTLRDWIAGGAAWPAARISNDRNSGSAGPVSTHWAFQPVQRPSGSHSIDGWIARKLQANGLQPAREASKAILIRRATMDLHGLPPAKEDIDRFLADARPDAYERLIERLLESPRYGEKWGKHWLDLARYGDTSGFEQDPYLLYAWRYRDYVIKSFNEDKPYDRFILEQIAGDEIFPEDPEAQQGTGFFTVGTNRDMLYKVEDINREESLTDFTDTTSSVFLGLTAGCARCHDHKFDPIPQREYFRLQAVFAPFVKTRVFLHYNNARGYDLNENTRTFRLYELGAQMSGILDPHRNRLREAKFAKMPKEIGEAYHTPDEKKSPEQKALVDANTKKFEPTDDEVFAQLTPAENERMRRIERRLVSMYRNYAPGPFSPAITDIGREAPRTYLPAKAGSGPVEVRAGMFTVLGGGDIPDPPVESATTLRRKALAEWIASPRNPLTARVMVNRIWQYHFGRGLNATPSDFGTRAGSPSHPELLDWLAAEFVDRKWSIKAMHKLIMTSATYKQSAQPASPKSFEADPENALLSHFTRRRLDSEEIRDSVLSAAGTLNLKMGGRAVVPPLATEELYGMSQPINNAWIVTDDAREHTRRSIYLISRRNFRVPLFEAFDRPEGVLSCSRRDSSTTAPQSLALLNGDFTLQQAKALAAKLEGAADPVAAAWHAVFGRNPTDAEAARSMQFLERQTVRLGSRNAALTEMARGLFNTNEFLYVD